MVAQQLVGTREAPDLVEALVADSPNGRRRRVPSRRPDPVGAIGNVTPGRRGQSGVLFVYLLLMRLYPHSGRQTRQAADRQAPVFANLFLNLALV